MIEKQILPAVSAIIFNELGEILLQRRKDVNQWCIISGHVEFGETVEEAMIREIEEEINVKSEIVRLIGIYSSPSSMTYIYNDRMVQYVTTYFEVKLQEHIPDRFSNQETQELRFFKPTEIPNDFAQINPHWLHDALDENRNVFIR